MITEIPHQSQLAKWQVELRDAISNPTDLLKQLELQETLDGLTPVLQQFPLRVPRGFVERMQKRNRVDPLLLQVLPLHQELELNAVYSLDPLGEKQALRQPGLLHKYKDRVLLTLTGACAIHCRYCFRRHFPYEANFGKQNWEQSLHYIVSYPEIKEVIFSGGDPLMLKDSLLNELIHKIANIAHIKRLRIHSRMPIVLPERITDELIVWMTKTRLQTVMVVHANHPNEINAAVKNAIQKLRAANITVLNQSVLLKDINDSSAALINLSEALFAAGIMPYYLNLLDKVQGAAHFDVSQEKARKIVWEMMQHLPGYLVPKLVREAATAPAKLPINIQ